MFKRQVRVSAVVLTLAVAATVLVAVPTAQAQQSVPKTASTTDNWPDRIGWKSNNNPWKTEKTDCNRFGALCKTFYFSSAKTSWIKWDGLGDLQGTFKLWFTVPKPNVHGTVTWAIKEKKTGSSDWTHVTSFRTTYHRTWDGGWRHFNRSFTVDGKVQVIATNTSGAKVGFQKVQLELVDVHPDYKDIAIALCYEGLLKAIDRAEWVGVALDIKSTVKGVRKGVKSIRRLMAATSGSATNLQVAKSLGLVIVEQAMDGLKDKVLEAAEEYIWPEAGMIREAERHCRSFHADWAPHRISGNLMSAGYHQFLDDAAKLSAEGL